MADIPTLAALSLAALFGVIGIVQLVGPRFLREAYRSWDYSQSLRVVTGVIDIAVAVMLEEPSLRGWGIALGAILTFGSVVTLLDHHQYAWAGAVMLMMAALLPATLAIPRANQVTFTEKAPQVFADTRMSPPRRRDSHDYTAENRQNRSLNNAMSARSGFLTSEFSLEP